MGVFNAVATWLDAILGHFGHGGASGTLIAIMTVAGIAGAAVLPGTVARRDRRRTMLLVTTAVTAVVFLAIAAVPGVVFAGCALAVEGFVLLAGLPVSLDWSELHAGPERAGTAAGFLLMAGNLGGTLFVVIIQAFIGNPYVALAAISVLALPGLALAFRLPAASGRCCATSPARPRSLASPWPARCRRGRPVRRRLHSRAAAGRPRPRSVTAPGGPGPGGARATDGPLGGKYPGPRGPLSLGGMHWRGWPPGPAGARARCRAAARGPAVAWLFLAGFGVAWAVSAALPPGRQLALLWWASTDVANLHHHPVSALIVSAFLPEGGFLTWVPLIALAMFGANRALGNARTALAVAAGHVLGTLVSEGIVAYRIGHGLLPAARRPDHGRRPVLRHRVRDRGGGAVRHVAGPVAAAACLALLVVAGNIFGGLSTLQVAPVGHLTAIGVSLLLAPLLMRGRARAAAGPAPVSAPAED